jgi:hypothetical protein
MKNLQTTILALLFFVSTFAQSSESIINSLGTITLRYKQIITKTNTAISFKVNVSSNVGENYVGFKIKNEDKIGLDNENKILLSNHTVQNTNSYELLDNAKSNTTCIILSAKNFKELNTKAETKMDFGNGLETFRISKMGFIEYPSLFENSIFHKKIEIILTNENKTITVAYFDYEAAPLITKIKTETQSLSLVQAY